MQQPIATHKKKSVKIGSSPAVKLKAKDLKNVSLMNYRVISCCFVQGKLLHHIERLPMKSVVQNQLLGGKGRSICQANLIQKDDTQ